MRQNLRSAIGTLGLVFVLFFSTSAGPYTTETLIYSVGPGLGLLILALVPLVWSVPEALIVGELASMLPEEGGYYRWVDRAFGRFWAFQNGWLTWMYSLVDMAIYPVLFNQYLRYFIPGLDARAEWLISLAIIWGAAWINVRGSVNVSRTSIIAGCFVMLGFLVLSVASTPHIPHIPLHPFVLACDGLLPKALAKLDVHGTPRMAVIVSAVFYSLFALVSFSKLVVADVLLYSLALFLEFGALVQLRKTEPSLRGVFRIPLGRTGVAVLAALPMMVLVGVIGVSFVDGEYGLPALIGAAVAIAAGPLMYRLAQRRTTGLATGQLH